MPRLPRVPDHPPPSPPPLPLPLPPPASPSASASASAAAAAAATAAAAAAAATAAAAAAAAAAPPPPAPPPSRGSYDGSSRGSRARDRQPIARTLATAPSIIDQNDRSSADGAGRCTRWWSVQKDSSRREKGAFRRARVRCETGIERDRARGLFRRVLEDRGRDSSRPFCIARFKIMS
ncbi:hypothetical protein V1478_001286 [Vespula squamosa]|uniref:Uncharacterized protein n=1 Tax=Vespula squamosa TaxID=30214 RepID=A0ABD2C136_VESSQ